MTATRTVVFVCAHGAAKSVIAAEYFRRLATERGLGVDATSAGTDPDPEIPPKVVAGLLDDGLDVRGHRPRRVTWEDLSSASHVVSFGCELEEIAPPGLPVERWDDIPAVSEDFTAARNLIVARLPRLLARWEGSPESAAG